MGSSKKSYYVHEDLKKKPELVSLFTEGAHGAERKRRIMNRGIVIMRLPGRFGIIPAWFQRGI